MIRLVVALYTFGFRSVYKPIPKITAAVVTRITQRLRTMMRKPNIKSMGLRSVSAEFGSKASTQCLPVADVRRVRCAVAATRTIAVVLSPCRDRAVRTATDSLRMTEASPRGGAKRRAFDGDQSCRKRSY